MQKNIFSDASWINTKRITVYTRLIVALYALLMLVWLALSPSLIDPNGKPVGTDFMNVWTAGKMVLNSQAASVYDYNQHFAVQKAALPWKTGQVVPFFGWHYPPMFLIIAALLALLPYGVALTAWMTVTVSLYLKTAHAILPGRDTLFAALAFPGIFINLGHGQNGCLTAALLGGGLLLLLKRRAILAGVLFGLMVYKPQFGILIPIALLSGKYWLSMVSAAATIVVMVVLSWLLLGGETWHAFLQSLPLTQGVLEQGMIGWPKMQSVFGAVRMLGGSVHLAYQIQMAVAVLVTLAVIWIWRQRVEFPLKASALALSTLVVSPYVLDYDLVILALPMAWMVGAGLREGILPWEKFILLLVWLLPLLSRLVGQSLGVPLAPVLLLLLWVLIIRRAILKNGSYRAIPESGAIER
jgi:alpha-1,2-mannosyltransferase